MGDGKISDAGRKVVFVLPAGIEPASTVPETVTRSIELWEPFDFAQGGVLSKKFEQISPKICRAGGIPPQPPLPPTCGSDSFGLDDFKFFVPLLAELRALLGLAANSFYLKVRI